MFRAVLDQFYHEHVETFQLLNRIARVHVGAICVYAVIV